MSVSIKKIEIYNFRSVRYFLMRPADLAVLVGRNDSGKSNVLRALNLFFNGETDPGQPFSFYVDHNVDNEPNRKAKECRVRLELSIPAAYQKTNGDYIIWEKRWRESGEAQDAVGYKGVRESVGPRGGKTLQYLDIPPRSNLHALLRNIKYVYVPAVKDRSYVSRLRGQIYSVIAEVAADRFRQSSAEFEKSISEHLEDLTCEVSRTMGLESKLALPRDLSHIFESLDFLNQDRSISLDQRGDGIKTRHIPAILKFMADKMHTLQVRGAQPYSFVWGYEEPENNQELTSSIALADQLEGYLDGSVSQMLITTHSPVFYNLHRNRDKGSHSVSCHHVYREQLEIGTKQVPNPDDIDDHMGTMKLFAPYMEEIEERVRQEQEALHEAERDLDDMKPYVYVEGRSDAIVLERAFKLFAPNFIDKVVIKSKESGAGHQYVVDMLAAWRHAHKHHPERPKAVGLVDADGPGSAARKNWNDGDGNVASAKCFQLHTPAHLIPAKQAGYNVPIVLESLYKKRIWDREKEDGNLDSLDFTSVVPKQKMQELVLNGGPGLEEELDDDWSVYVTRKIKNDRKIQLAKCICQLPDDEAAHELAEFRPNVLEIVDFLYGGSTT